MAQDPVKWHGAQNVAAKSYICGECGTYVSSERGLGRNQHPIVDHIYFCPLCGWPTSFINGRQTPGVAFGQSVQSLPDDIGNIYNEARRAFQVNAFTSSVMMCRKLLMHVAIQKGASLDKGFSYYVDYLDEKGYVPPDGKQWVDHIRKMGNKGNHELEFFTREQAEEVVIFTQMLLILTYEFPSRLSKVDKGSANP